MNEVTVKDAYPLPRIDESLAGMGKAKNYTSIDLAWASSPYWFLTLQVDPGYRKGDIAYRPLL